MRPTEAEIPHPRIPAIPDTYTTVQAPDGGFQVGAELLSSFSTVPIIHGTTAMGMPFPTETVSRHGIADGREWLL
jgi:hypothetical protein